MHFAEKLLATFEENIGHLMFTCTGSEANDLALRMAKYHTGHEGIIVTSEAYHGNSELTWVFTLDGRKPALARGLGVCLPQTLIGWRPGTWVNGWLHK